MDSRNGGDARYAASETYFALHAGVSESWETDLNRQQEIEQVLVEIAETARSNLSAGASALDVVEAAVVALEDCSLFNAGKGAALSEDGSHEVCFEARRL